jgi:hypothetical protein
MDIKILRDLCEAYSGVYTPQELTEEQIWEEVENWVNSLIEEGYDLSDYSWEEMYEAYIEEQGGRRRQAGTGPGIGGLIRGAAGNVSDVVGAAAQGVTGQKTTSTNPLARVNNAVARTISAPARTVLGSGSNKPNAPRLGNINPNEGTRQG